ncbi:MAG: phenylacetate-CoA oxygenase subunit PaaI [Bacteroidetes bacterium]|nr:MAG: phenylacetate-CoA oxygenase subunit PaaI [Bacteroidota bacterium]
MPDKTNLKFQYLLQLGDNALILGQRLAEWCGHGPVLEQDIAVTNIALDQLGQARNWFEYAATVEGKNRTADDLAFLRDEWDYRNAILVEQPNKDWAHTVVRQFFFDTFNHALHEALTSSRDESVAAIAAKSLKEIKYHLRWSSEWVIRLGDGTDLSHQKMKTALENLWTYRGELFEWTDADTAMFEAGIGADLDALRPAFDAHVQKIMDEATLPVPEEDWAHSGGKKGRHSEHLGHLLTELQYMQRAYPGMDW